MLGSLESQPEIHPHRLLLWGGLVLFIIVGSVWYVAQQFLLEEELHQIESDIQQVNVPVKPKMASSTIESGIDTSNWKTYRNEEYGFEFRYPVAFSFRDGYEIAAINKDNDLVYIGKIKKSTVEEFIREELLRINQEMSGPHCESCGYGGPPSEPKIFTFHGSRATRQEQGDEAGTYRIISIPEKGLKIQYSSSNYEHLPKLEEILETFKFTK
ncbi:MAG: hypothetical protein AAB372_00185 [Patescibacteria group bacterium]